MAKEKKPESTNGGGKTQHHPDAFGGIWYRILLGCNTMPTITISYYD